MLSHAVIYKFVYLYSVKHLLEIDNDSLIEECLKGDKEALNLLYVRFAPRMLSIIRRYVSNPKDAEDILHDGFIVAFTRLSTLRDYDRVDYWLATIMKNLSLQFLSSQDLAGILHELPEIEDTPKIDEILDLDTLEMLIKKLPAGYQKVFRLAVLENKSHKEIGKLLGIAPNTSSSQLFHAKLMMRKLINEYRLQCGLASLLIAIFIGGLVFWKNHYATEPASPGLQLAQEKPAINEKSGVSSEISEPIQSTIIHKPAAVATTTIAPVVSVNADTIHFAENLPFPAADESANEHEEEEISVAESRVPANEDSIMPVFDDEPLYAYFDNEPIRESRSGGWTLKAGISAGITNFCTPDFKDYDDDIGYIGSPDDSFSNGPILSNPPGGADNPYNQNENLPRRSRSAESFNDYEYASHRHYIPNSFYVTLNKEITGSVSIESGLAYTYLHSTFESNDTKSTCHWHYLGVPLKFNFIVKTGNRFNIYTSLGAKVDFPLFSNAVITQSKNRPSLKSGRFNSSVVWSTSISLGVSLKLSKNTELFVEPTLNYHFKHDYTVPNILTEEPWGVSIPIGVRFNINK